MRTLKERVELAFVHLQDAWNKKQENKRRVHVVSVGRSLERLKRSTDKKEAEALARKPCACSVDDIREKLLGLLRLTEKHPPAAAVPAPRPETTRIEDLSSSSSIFSAKEYFSDTSGVESSSASTYRPKEERPSVSNLNTILQNSYNTQTQYNANEIHQVPRAKKETKTPKKQSGRALSPGDIIRRSAARDLSSTDTTESVNDSSDSLEESAEKETNKTILGGLKEKIGSCLPSRFQKAPESLSLHPANEVASAEAPRSLRNNKKATEKATGVSVLGGIASYSSDSSTSLDKPASFSPVELATPPTPSNTSLNSSPVFSNSSESVKEKLEDIKNEGSLEDDERFYNMIGRSIDQMKKRTDFETIKTSMQLDIARKYIKDFIDLRMVLQKNTHNTKSSTDKPSKSNKKPRYV
ncbi:hypothetical protein NEDG_02164 [Nematocida displodere]|uniref:Uncharacterized protein n=1 Tax=Nematocida displodere TaxID=1805483 RepID=A0A177EN68_9MICR|nr:hypothetical protein NEDG_02164 [Nematocida displodere]